MKNSSQYLHITGGRLRIKLPTVKNSKEIAAKVEQLLAGQAGINSVKANPSTGNVLVLFDSTSIRHEDIVETIRKEGYLKEQKAQRTAKAPSNGRVFNPNIATNLIADILLQKALELTVRRVLVALL